MDDGEKRFNQLSIEERGKFDEETLVNVNSIKRNKAGSQRSSGFSNEYIVVCSQMAPGFLSSILCVRSTFMLCSVSKSYYIIQQCVIYPALLAYSF